MFESTKGGTHVYTLDKPRGRDCREFVLSRGTSIWIPVLKFHLAKEADKTSTGAACKPRIRKQQHQHGKIMWGTELAHTAQISQLLLLKCIRVTYAWHAAYTYFANTNMTTKRCNTCSGYVTAMDIIVLKLFHRIPDSVPHRRIRDGAGKKKKRHSHSRYENALLLLRYPPLPPLLP
jgi:hypothetical protein